MKKSYRLNFIRPQDFEPLDHSSGFFSRMWRAFRLPRRGRSEVERAARKHQALRLFEPTFKSSWNR